MRGRVLAAGLLLAGALSGCGGDPQADYCAQVADRSQSLAKTLDAGGRTTGLLDALPTLDGLAEDAPSDIRADWRTLLDALHGLRSALDAAGLEPADVDGALPKDLAASHRKALEQASIELASLPVQDAATAVEQHARDVCHTALF